jgi:hypothetical protein
MHARKRRVRQLSLDLWRALIFTSTVLIGFAALTLVALSDLLWALGRRTPHGS